MAKNQIITYESNLLLRMFTFNETVFYLHAVKKRSKVPESEIQKAKQLRIIYFENKEKSNKEKK